MQLYKCYRDADKSSAQPTSRCILFDGENISFDASLVIYINSTNIPPIMIRNRIYEHQNLLSLELVSFLLGLRTYQHPCIYLFTKQNTCGSFIMGHHIFFSPLSESAWVTFGGKWIGRGDSWPAGSPDFNVLDFWLWWQMKTYCVQRLSMTWEILEQRVENAC